MPRRTNSSDEETPLTQSQATADSQLQITQPTEHSQGKNEVMYKLENASMRILGTHLTRIS